MVFIFWSEFLGPTPSLTDGTKYKIQLSQKIPDNDMHWEMWLTGLLESEVTIQVKYSFHNLFDMFSYGTGNN